jgi:hypothetical protein
MSIRLRSSSALLVVCLASLAATFAGSARADEDALAPYRDRFRLGMEKYKAGAVAEAVRVWSAIYEEIGPKRGYRLSFNLARAYDTNGEATRAAERYRSFLDEVETRQRANEAIEPLVEREAHDADERLAVLNREHGRIQVTARADATLAQVDDADPRLGAFTAYVAPGKHVVTFGPGREDAAHVDVSVAAGEIVVATAPDSTLPPSRSAPLAVDPITHRETRHPFSRAVLYAGGVATAASVIAPAMAYSYANSLVTTYRSTTASQASKTQAFGDYPGARTLAYATVAAPVTLGVVTGILTTWYFAGAHEVTVTASGDVTARGGTAMVRGTF